MLNMNGLLEGALVARDAGGLTEQDIREALSAALSPALPRLNRVLLVPPDATRAHSGAGAITQALYGMLSPGCRVDILPALGTHLPMSQPQWQALFGDIPHHAMLVHSWRQDLVTLGEVPGEVMARLSDGRMTDPVPVEVSRHIVNPAYDLILSIGQVVPHEVVGMANHTKNILVGCGGSHIINASHMLGAICGMEQAMGRDHSPVRQLLDYAAAQFLQQLPLSYILTVTDAPAGAVRVHGLFLGRDRHWFEQAVALSQQRNITLLDEPLHKVVVYADPEEFQSTWLANKAIYRTRMAMMDGGELIVLAPGVDRFGEDSAVDALIRGYGYRGTEAVLARVQADEALQQNLSAAAHLIHGSAEGRFTITYAPGHLDRAAVEGVGYQYLPYEEAKKRYPPDQLKEGMNRLADGEQVYFIRNPALGLWMTRDRLDEDFVTTSRE